MASGDVDRIREYARTDIDAGERAAAVGLLSRASVAVFVPGYKVEGQIGSVIDRIPPDLLPRFAEILVVDNRSPDGTAAAALRARDRHPDARIRVVRTPSNRGYGGSQKLGYLHAMEQGYDIVVMLHGDGQYAPEYLPRILAAFDDGTDAVFGSRMINKAMALRGGMPVYKWVGNQLLTAFENRLLGTRLSEFHTGYRAYRTRSLAKIPFAENSDDFHFDTEIIIQAVATGWRIREVAIPAHYGDESNNVNGLRYSWDCAKAVLRYNLVNLGILYERNYDFGSFDVDKFRYKKSRWSLHQHLVREASFPPGAAALELGAHDGALSAALAGRADRYVAADRVPPAAAGEAEAVSVDLEGDFSATLGERRFDVVLALDVVEHRREAEAFLREIFRVLKPGGELWISTANICYFPSRLLLFLGQASYGKIGILDRSHLRLFTVGSLGKLLAQEGFRVEKVLGFPPPLSDLVSGGPAMRTFERIHAALSRRLPRLFAYHFLVAARRQDSVLEVLTATFGPPSPRARETALSE